MDTFVVAIAGHSGAGKSTIIQHLVSRFVDANSLSLDEYEESSTYPPAAQWIADGADPNQFLTPQFDADVRALKQGSAITHPVTGEKIAPASYLFLEEPFGKERDAISSLIDLVIYVDTPLEIAYVRKIGRKNDFLPWEDDPQQFIKNLRENITWYQEVGRRFYLAIRNRVKDQCDRVVDGMLPTGQIVDEILRAIEIERRNRADQTKPSLPA